MYVCMYVCMYSRIVQLKFNYIQFNSIRFELMIYDDNAADDILYNMYIY